MERRISRRFSTAFGLEILIPRAGILGRAKTVELQASDLSMFGVAVRAAKSDGLKKGQVVQVSLNDKTTSAIVRREETVEEVRGPITHYGLEFIRPNDDFIVKIHDITNAARRLIGEEVSEELWLRSS